jgi:hypothetical protein
LSDIFAQPAVSGGYSVAQITSAYLASNLSFVTSLKGSITGNGSGQTIAIVDAYNDPNIVSDVNTFSTKFGLPKVTNANLKVVSQTGSSSLPASSSDWDLEISLDVEWAHAIAPAANIVLVEAKSSSLSDLLTAVQYASTKTGASVVSMSWGTDEFRGETSYDSYFTTPGVTFVASSGDSGVTSWPSVSSNVLAVGGTTLTVTSSSSGYSYGGETAWSDSGGGVSSYEALPSYQKMIGISASGRVTPDVSYDANPSTGFLVYDSVATGGSSGWMVVGGTSAGAPQWAGIIAIANEGRVANGLSTLTQANAMIYTIYDTSGKSAQDFHDVTSGRNTSGFSAMKGYDAVTGLGSPIVSSLVSDLATATATSGPTSTTKITIGTTPGSGGLGGWGGWGGGWSGWGGGWSGWWSPFGMTASSTQPSAPAALPWHPASDSSPALHAEVAATSQVVVAPITNVSTADLSSSPQPARSTTWEGSFGDGAPSIEYASGADEATVAIFGPASTGPQFQLHIPAALASRATDTVFTQSLPSETDEALAVVDGQPQLAPEEIEHSTRAATQSQSRTQQPAADTVATSVVELSGSTIAALVFAWQLRVNAAETERDRRRVDRAS